MGGSVSPVRRVAAYAVLVALAAFLLAPFVWMGLVSLHPSRSPIPDLATIIPRQPAWDNYATVLVGTDLPVARFALNSLVVTSLVVGGQLLVCSLAAFAFARLDWRGRETVFALFLLSLMIAGPVTQIPVFLMLRAVGALDTLLALVAPGVGSAFGVFLLRQAFLAVPRELDEAARIDGASHWTVYARVVLPLSGSALATLGAFAFIATWTDFFWPLLATSSLENRTLEVGLSVFKDSYGGTDWPLQMAAAVIVLAPLLLVFLALQRYFVRGVTLGSGK